MFINKLETAIFQSSASTSLSSSPTPDFALFLQSELTAEINDSLIQSFSIRELKNIIASMYLDRWLKAETDEEREKISALFESIITELGGISSNVTMSDGVKITDAFTTALDDLKKAA